MEFISYTALRQNLSSIMDVIEDDRVVYKISRKDHKNLIMMTEEDYNSMEETLHLLSSSANVAHLEQSMKEAENGEFGEVKWTDED